MITLKLDVSKINKDRLFKGAKGTYLDAVLIETPNSEYGDFMIVESVTKEEREAGVKGTILGNAKTIGSKPTQSTTQQTPNYAEHGNPDFKGDVADLPF